MSERKLLIDDLWGVNIPKRFFENFDLPEWGLDPKIFEELSDPDRDGYWDTWQDLLDMASFTDPEGKEWLLYHNAGLWAVPAHEVEEES